MKIQKTYNIPFTSIHADRTGKALISHRINQNDNQLKDWQDLLEILNKEKDNPNEILITKKGGDDRLKAIITHAKTRKEKKVYEGLPKFNSPIEFIKKVIIQEKEFDRILSLPENTKFKIK